MTESADQPAFLSPLDDVNARNLALLHEVDHRVKNNLQLVVSLLVLQRRRETNPQVRAALAAILGRVNAVAVVHRRLFQDDPQTFDIATFLGDLVEDRGEGPAKIQLSAERAEAPTAVAAPLALVVNELLANAVTHAFPGDRTGSIAVSVGRQADKLWIEIADDGVGVPSDLVDGFGLTIVRILCRQLKADFEMRPADPGIRAIVILPIAATALEDER